jgi:hypothetical protein
MKHLRVKVWVLVLVAFSVMLISSPAPAGESLKVRITVPYNVNSGVDFPVRVDFSNESSTPKYLSKWFVVSASDTQNVKGPCELPTGPKGWLNPGANNGFVFNYNITANSGAVVPICVFVECIVSQKFGNMGPRNITEISGGHTLLVKVN